MGFVKKFVGVAERVLGTFLAFVFCLTFFLVIRGQVSLSHLIGCFIQTALFYAAMVLVWLGFLWVLLLPFRNVRLSNPRVTKINFVMAVVLAFLAIWFLWDCVGIQVNL